MSLAKRSCDFLFPKNILTEKKTPKKPKNKMSTFANC